MSSRQDKDLKVRNSTYFKKSTEKLLKSKSAKLGISANSLKEFCLMRHIPEMQMWNYKTTNSPKT